MLVPDALSNMTVSVSNLSHVDTSRLNIIFHVHDNTFMNSLLLTTPFPQITASLSLNAPEYLDNANWKANLNLSGSVPISFVVNGTAARQTPFGIVLEEMGFN